MCTFEPISRDRLIDLFDELLAEGATPSAAAPAGSPAPIKLDVVDEPGENAQLAVELAIEAWVACRNVGDPARLLSAHTDSMIKRGILEPWTSEDPEQLVRYFFPEYTEVLPPGLQAGIEEFSDFGKLADGRIVATVALLDPRSAAGSISGRPHEPGRQIFLNDLTEDDIRISIVFVVREVEGTWLIDGFQISGES